MSQQYPQQPYPPQQPGWGAPPPPPPKKSSAGKVIGFGCLGIVALIVVIGIVGALASSSGDNKDSGTSVANSSAPAAQDKASTQPSKAAKSEAPKKKTVTFKVWGTAPASALGPIDITYGSDSDNRKGKFDDGKFEATLPLDDKAMYYSVTAQLQGSGDINCSITVDGHTEKGHASGGYNICSAQANAGLLGGWD